MQKNVKCPYAPHVKCVWRSSTALRDSHWICFRCVVARTWFLAIALCAQPVYSAGTVTNCTEPCLRAALVDGGQVKILCDGTIALSAPLIITNATSLDASDHQVVLSGNGAVRVFEIRFGACLWLTNLVLADGTNNNGGAIFNEGTDVFCDGCVFMGNQAHGADVPDNASGEPAAGGAILSYGSLTLVNCVFATNRVAGGTGSGGNYGGGEARGGAIYAEGRLLLSNVVFLNNECAGGRSGRGETGWGPNGADAFGGAVCCTSNLDVFNCVFRGNVTSAGWPGGWRAHRGNGYGGALAIAGGTAWICGTLFESNSVSGCAGLGGAIWHSGDYLLLSNSTLRANEASGDKLSYYYDAGGGPGAGGGLCVGSPCTVLNCTFQRNRCIGGPGNQLPFGWGMPGGPGLGGAVFSTAQLRFEQSTIVYNLAHGGDQSGVFAPGGDAFGGGICIGDDTAALVNLTVYANTACGGAPDPWIGFEAGSASGGGLCVTNGVAGLTNCTLLANAATGIPYPDFNGQLGEEQGGGLANVATGALSVFNSIVAGSISGGDVYGTFTGGYNLISGEPRLAGLANNGGPTLTLALYLDSPAIDAADPISAPPVDQRGVARPFGFAPDIGAFEWNGPVPAQFYIHTPVLTDTGCALTVYGPPDVLYRLQASDDLAEWSDICTNQNSWPGFSHLTDPILAPARFYRIVSP